MRLARPGLWALLMLICSLSWSGAAQSAMRTLAGTDNPAVAATAPSVMRIVSFANPGTRPPRRVATETLPRLTLKTLAFPLSPENRAAFQGEVCRLNNLHWCPVFTEETRGTAFGIAEPGRFMTCRHVVQDWIYWAFAFNDGVVAFDDIIPPFALTTDAGKLLYVSAAPGAGGFTKALFARHRALIKPVHVLIGDDFFWNADFMEFNLADGLGIRPLRRRTSFDPGEKIIVIGYPEGGSARFDIPLVESEGRVTGRDAIGITTNAASAKGMSGAPVIDEAGHVGGMACAIGRKQANRKVRPALAIPVDPAELRKKLSDLHNSAVSADR